MKTADLVTCTEEILDDDNEWLTDERRLALFPAGTIVWDPHHCEFPTRPEQGMNLRRIWVQA